MHRWENVHESLSLLGTKLHKKWKHFPPNTNQNWRRKILSFQQTDEHLQHLLFNWKLDPASTKRQKLQNDDKKKILTSKQNQTKIKQKTIT